MGLMPGRNQPGGGSVAWCKGSYQKSHLLIGVGTAVAEPGLTVRYTIMAALVNELTEAEARKNLISTPLHTQQSVEGREYMPDGGRLYRSSWLSASFAVMPRAWPTSSVGTSSACTANAAR